MTRFKTRRYQGYPNYVFRVRVANKTSLNSFIEEYRFSSDDYKGAVKQVEQKRKEGYFVRLDTARLDEL